MKTTMPKTILALVAVSLVAVALLAGCGGGNADGPPDLSDADLRCTACGMAVTDPKFAAAIRTTGGGVEAYDSIECLVGDLRTRTGERAPAGIWLSDLPSGELHPAAAMTVVLADFPSPMGGGYAAFLSAETAAAEAARRGGVAGPLAEFVAGNLRRPAGETGSDQ
ncbi:MAG: hypothetical protein ABR506_06515 [Candidatus Krumholzibacteriia bacterium]